VSSITARVMLEISSRCRLTLGVHLSRLNGISRVILVPPIGRSISKSVKCGGLTLITAKLSPIERKGKQTMNDEIRNLANALGLVVASVWNGYTRRWIVSERDAYYPLYTTTDYATLIEGLKNGGRFPPL